MVAVKVNAEYEGRALAKKYGVTGFPTVLYLDAEGGEWGRMPGFLAAQGFITVGSEALKAYKEQPALEAKLKRNPGDLALATDLAQRFADQGNEPKALWVVGLVTKAPQSGKCAAAYNALGSLYIRKQNAPKARTWLQKALAVATEGRDKAYAHFGLAFCFMGERNAKGTRAELNAALKTPGCPERIQENARKLLEQIPP